MEKIEKVRNQLKRSPTAVVNAPKSDEIVRQPELIGIVSLSAIVLMVAISYFFRPQISFALIYLLIVFIATWKDGKISGLFVTLVSVIILAFNEISRSSKIEILCWNIGVQIGVSLFAVWLANRARDVVKRLEKNIANQKFYLEEQITGHNQTEGQLQKTMQQLRQLAENIADAFWIKDPQTDRIVYVSPAYEKIWGRNCKELYQSPEVWLEAIHPEDRKQIAHAAAVKQSTGEYHEKFRIIRPDGTTRWIRDRAFPIRDGSGKIIRIVGIAEDITEQHQLERQILEISDAERVRIGQDLHDSLCQKLISIAFDNNSLEQKLAKENLSEAETVRKIGEILDDAITEARAISRGLFPVQLEANGLKVALEQLADSVASRSKINCRFDCPQPVSVNDNIVATHLYRIAQEAVTNAVKHGKANSIVIQLCAVENRIELKITDNGIGIPVSRNSTGMGLHIMNYRARTIGGSLEIERAPNGGTIVFCSARQSSI